MYFTWTTETLFQLTTEMTIQREHELADALRAYEQQLEAEHTIPDRSLLRKAKFLLQERLTHGNLDTELACLGFEVYDDLGEWDEARQLLERYLEQPRSVEEEAWARWHRVDCLALLRRCAEAVQAQRELLTWAVSLLPIGQCLWVMNDTTQALCWMLTGQEDAWLRLLHDLMSRVEPTQENRLERFYYLRSATELLTKLGRGDEVPPLIEHIYTLAQEESTWEHSFDILIEADCADIKAATQLQNVTRVRTVGMLATERLAHRQRCLGSLSLEQKRRLRTLYHNLAAALYFAKQYDLAIPLFRQTIAYHTMPPHAYLWLAASLWATTKDREQVLPLLVQAASRFMGDGPWGAYQKLPEFEDVRDDPQFQQAARVPH